MKQRKAQAKEQIFPNTWTFLSQLFYFIDNYFLTLTYTELERIPDSFLHCIMGIKDKNAEGSSCFM